MMNALDYLMIFEQDRNCSIGDVAIRFVTLIFIIGMPIDNVHTMRRCLGHSRNSTRTPPSM